MRVKQKAQEAGSKAAAIWLVLLILAISLTPRLRLDGGADGNIDLRLQDILMVPIVLFLIVNRRPFAPLRTLWGWLLPTFLCLAVMVALLVTMLDPEVSLFRRAAFFARGLELFVLAAVVAGLYLRAGGRALQAALGAISWAAIVNFGWVSYQLYSRDNFALLGGEVGDNIESYGPKLIGEASAFGTGQFFAFVAAVGVARWQGRIGNRWRAFALILMGAAGAWVSSSRVSILAIVLLALVMLIVPYGRRALSPAGVTFAAIGAVIAMLTVLPELAGRLTPEAIAFSLGFRITAIWEPLFDALGRSPFLGIGPGALSPPMAIEAHNIILRALLDYGVIVGVMFLALFLVVIRKSWRATREPEAASDHRVFSNLSLLFVVAVLVSGMFQDALTGVTSSHLAMLSIGLFAAVNARVSPTQIPMQLRAPSNHWAQGSFA